MNFVGNFLTKFTKILETGEANCQAIIDVVREVTGIILEAKEITCRDGVIKLSVKPIFKTEIKLKEKEILARLNQDLSSDVWKKII